MLLPALGHCLKPIMPKIEPLQKAPRTAFVISEGVHGIDAAFGRSIVGCVTTQAREPRRLECVLPCSLQMFRYFPGNELSAVPKSRFKCEFVEEDGSTSCYDPTARDWYVARGANKDCCFFPEGTQLFLAALYNASGGRQSTCFSPCCATPFPVDLSPRGVLPTGGRLHDVPLIMQTYRPLVFSHSTKTELGLQCRLRSLVLRDRALHGDC